MPGKKSPYTALPDCLTIKKSKLHGLGVFATRDIPAGTELGITHITDKKKGRFPNDSIRTPLGAFINHSQNPNCVFYKIEDGWRLKTLLPVKKDEELTAEYDDWYDKETLAEFK